MSKQFTFTTEITLSDGEAEVEITYSVSPYYPATREQPAEGGEIELISVMRDGIELKLTDEIEAELLEKCEARAQQDCRDALDEALEAKADAERERRSDEWWQP